MNTSEIPGELSRVNMISSHVMIETSSVPPRKSSVNFGYLQKSSEKVRKRFSNLRKSFDKISQIFGKWSEVFGKSSLKVCLYNKQMRERVRYRVKHEEIKIISTRGHVISSIFSATLILVLYLLFSSTIETYYRFQYSHRNQSA